jgi:hypothetical protein
MWKASPSPGHETGSRPPINRSNEPIDRAMLQSENNPRIAGGYFSSARTLKTHANFKKRRVPTRERRWSKALQPGDRRKTHPRVTIDSQGDSPLADAYPQMHPHRRMGFRLVAAPATRSGALSGREHDDAGSLPDRCRIAPEEGPPGIFRPRNMPARWSGPSSARVS